MALVMGSFETGVCSPRCMMWSRYSEYHLTHRLDGGGRDEIWDPMQQDLVPQGEGESTIIE
jgi:hypothetical protein